MHYSWIKSKERVPEIVNNSHVIGLFSGLAEPTICADEIQIMTIAQLLDMSDSMGEKTLSPNLGCQVFRFLVDQKQVVN